MVQTPPLGPPCVVQRPLFISKSLNRPSTVRPPTHKLVKPIFLGGVGLYQSHKLPPLHLPLLSPTLLLPIPSLPRNIYDNVANDTALIVSISHLLRRPNNHDQDAATLCVSVVEQGCMCVCKWHFSKARDWLDCLAKSVRVNICFTRWLLLMLS